MEALLVALWAELPLGQALGLAELDCAAVALAWLEEGVALLMELALLLPDVETDAEARAEALAELLSAEELEVLLLGLACAEAEACPEELRELRGLLEARGDLEPEGEAERDAAESEGRGLLLPDSVPEAAPELLGAAPEALTEALLCGEALPWGAEALAEAEPSAAEAEGDRLGRQALTLALELLLPSPPAAGLLEALAAAEGEKLPQPPEDALPLRQPLAEEDALPQAVPPALLALAEPEAPLLVAEAAGRAEEDLLLLLLGEAEPEPPPSCRPPLAEALLLRRPEPESRAGELLQSLYCTDGPCA